MKSSPNQRIRQAGFTLIELLVVIAVMAILIAIIIPNIGVGIKKAKEVSCRQNLRSQGVGFFALTSELEGRLLEYNENGLGPYMTYMQDFVEQKESLFCPEAPKVEGRNGWGGRNYAWKYRTTWSSYTFNGWLHFRGTPSQVGNDIRIWPVLKYEWHWGNTLGQVDTPSDTPLFCDGYWIDTWPIKTQPPPTSGLESENRTGNHGKFLHRAVTDRHHPDRENMAFVDGHVKSVLFAEMPNFIWSREYLTP